MRSSRRFPFELAVLIQNYGAGEARNLRIESGQPQIIENDKGLLIDFNIIGSELDGEPMQPSLNLNFGNIAPGDTTVGRWFMTSSLLDHFTEYEATFRHLDGLGDDRLSLIKDVDIHELIHTVYVTGDLDDGKSDFLVNELADGYDLPDTLYLSDGSVADVTQAENISADGVVTADDYVIELDRRRERRAGPTSGWTTPVRPIMKSSVSSGATPTVERPIYHWTISGRPTIRSLVGACVRSRRTCCTSSTTGVPSAIPCTMSRATRSGPVVVTLPIFRDLSGVDPEVAALLGLQNIVQEDPVDSIEIEFSKAIDPATFTRSMIWPWSAIRADNLITEVVTIEQLDETHYHIGGLATLNEEGGDYAIVVYTEGIQDTFGNDGAGVWSTGWMKVGDAPAVLSVSGAPIGARSTPVESIDHHLLGADRPGHVRTRMIFRSSRDSGDNLLTAPLEIVQLSDRDLPSGPVWSDLTDADGEYDLLINMTDVTDLDGVAGEGEWWSNWTMDAHAPEVAAIFGAEEATRSTPIAVADGPVSRRRSSRVASLRPRWRLPWTASPVSLGGVLIETRSASEYRITGLVGLTADEGEYQCSPLTPAAIRRPRREFRHGFARASSGPST